MRARTPLTGQASLWFGGDYNPEQWPDELRDADLDALERLGVNTVTLGIFSWALIHPAKDTFDLGWLERVVDDVAARGIGVVLATPTAAQPAWMSAAYPEILPVDASGHRRRHGGRVNYCPSSTAYREASAEIAGVLAERFRRPRRVAPLARQQRVRPGVLLRPLPRRLPALGGRAVRRSRPPSTRRGAPTFGETR